MDCSSAAAVPEISSKARSSAHVTGSQLLLVLKSSRPQSPLTARLRSAAKSSATDTLPPSTTCKRSSLIPPKLARLRVRFWSLARAVIAPPPQPLGRVRGPCDGGRDCGEGDRKSVGEGK